MHSRSPGGFGRPFPGVPLLLFILGATIAGLIASTACGEEDAHIAFIGAVDAAPPRLGRRSPDAGDEP